MGEPIAEVGYLAGICAHDGADWQKLKIDAEGRLEVSVVAGLEYVDRGDPATHDFIQTDLQMDNTWYALSLSGIVTDSDAVLVHLLVGLQDDTPGTALYIREFGNANSVNIAALVAQVANIFVWTDCLVTIDATRDISYKVSAVATAARISVRGWWRPAA